MWFVNPFSLAGILRANIHELSSRIMTRYCLAWTTIPVTKLSDCSQIWVIWCFNIWRVYVPPRRCRLFRVRYQLGGSWKECFQHTDNLSLWKIEESVDLIRSPSNSHWRNSFTIWLMHWLNTEIKIGYIDCFFLLYQNSSLGKISQLLLLSLHSKLVVPEGSVVSWKFLTLPIARVISLCGRSHLRWKIMYRVIFSSG